MSSLNKAQVIGNLTRDPELRQTPGGQAVCSVGIATNRRWTDRESGEKKEQVEFHSIVCWGGLANTVAQYAHKGDKIFFEGRLQTRNWEDEAGHKNYRTEIVADNMILLGGRGAIENVAVAPDFTAAPAPTPKVDEKASSKKPTTETKKDDEIRVEDLPF